AVHEIKNVGNFGKLVHHEWTARHVRTPNGLWEVVIGGGRFVSAPEPRANQTLSLCGLIPLLRSARFSTELGGTIDTRLRVKSLRTDSTRLCAPGPDAAFDYQVESELQTKSTGMFRQTTTRTLSSDVRCRAAGESRPASELATGLNGQYLPVSCESVSNGSDKVNLRFAFVDQLGVYLVLTESARHAETTTHYKELAIRQ
ncbi:MAG TPA: hypothetical protein VM491_12920, partial [Burkholderiaceae bacterium]|nr:hypothetical protein [Burkholderiaceae bacterium]